MQNIRAALFHTTLYCQSPKNTIVIVNMICAVCFKSSNFSYCISQGDYECITQVVYKNISVNIQSNISFWQAEQDYKLWKCWRSVSIFSLYQKKSHIIIIIISSCFKHKPHWILLDFSKNKIWHDILQKISL